MATYKYKAITNEGKNIEGTYEASDQGQVVKMIREQKQIPIKIKEMKKQKDLEDFSFGGKVNAREIAVFCRQFHTMLNSGVPIVKCLDILRRQTENKKLKESLNEIYGDVQKGLILSDALKKHRKVFPDLLVNMIKSGELSGSLDSVIDRMATHYEKEFKINNKVKSAMMYPLIVAIVAVCVVIFMLMFVFPTFLEMFDGSDQPLPGITQLLLNISDLMREFWYILFGGIFAIVFGTKAAYETEKGKKNIDGLILKMPVIKNSMQKIYTSRFTRTLATLLASGLPLIQSLDTSGEIIGNAVMRDGLIQTKEDVRKGADLSKAVKRTGLFPPMVDSMIQIGEESGSLDSILQETANFYDEETETAIQKMVALIEPLMIVTMALIIGFIVIAMILPMFEMMNTI
ncbi:type II secretion system F family protein [Serpentinicella sp. ANB-PHB4]|uniref:type II secretion system F family protein n=1 Tax=Serpentinicella sp. ANB-PHB4 TaxID=3074076 RepID=UPI002857057D|nr:type II secretion system F family protein [Serpentinicella sp. ANB-PHB4]MDR5658122.1 type II secretion system F family protein [Serpentinicella sp. ANB-PHB4]